MDASVAKLATAFYTIQRIQGWNGRFRTKLNVISNGYTRERERDQGIEREIESASIQMKWEMALLRIEEFNIEKMSGFFSICVFSLALRVKSPFLYMNNNIFWPKWWAAWQINGRKQSTNSQTNSTFIQVSQMFSVIAATKSKWCSIVLISARVYVHVCGCGS